MTLPAIFLWQEKLIPSSYITEKNIQVTALNEKLAPFRFKLEKYLDNYIIINQQSDDVAKKYGTSYSPTEIEFLKSLVDRIVENEGCEIKNEDINALATSAIKKQGLKRVIQMFAGDGWMENTENGIVLGPRTYLEFEERLEASEFSFCKGCNKILNHKVKVCGNCQESVHEFCWIKQMKNARDRNITARCLYCNVPYQEGE